MTGWNLPPGCTTADIDPACGADITVIRDEDGFYYLTDGDGFDIAGRSFDTEEQAWRWLDMSDNAEEETP